MQKVVAEIEVSKEAYELGLALAKIVKSVQLALKDGAQASDIPQLLATLMSEDVVKGIQGIDLLGEELKQSKEMFIAAFGVAAYQAFSEK